MNSEKIDKTRTRVFKTVFPGETNHYDTLFGGTALHWMDEVAFIAATRFTREKVVTVSSDKVNFKTPISSGSIVELDAQIVRVGNTSLEVRVDVYKKICIQKNEISLCTVVLFLSRLIKVHKRKLQEPL